MSAHLKSFVTAVEAFQDWVKTEAVEKEKEAVTALKLLSSLYAGAIQLMTVEAGREEPESNEGFAVGVDEWKEVYDRLDNMPLTY